MRILACVLWGMCLFAALEGACERAVGQAAAEPYDPYAVEPPAPSPSDGVITLIDEAGKKRLIDADDLAALARRKVEVRDKEAVKHYEGVALVDVLKHFGVGFGDALRGKRAAVVALCDARDDYRIPISLLEIDPETGDETAIIADRCDGQALAASEGPFRLVMPGDKRQIRSIRMLKKIQIVNLRDVQL